jgi:preprotein translocase subunit SecF
MGWFGDLYHGNSNFRIVEHTKRWFIISGVVLAVGLVGLFIRGLNLGIDFRGGVVWEFPAADLDVDGARSFVEDLGVPDPKVQTLTAADGSVRFRVQGEIDVEAATPAGGTGTTVAGAPAPDNEQAALAEAQDIQAALAERVGVPLEEVSLSSIGPSWGEQITNKAIRALVVFLIAITIYVTMRFELKMAWATLAALVHDVLFTIGVYALLHLEVTPATVVAILTILGFSIYDGIVVFDKVDENTRLVSSTRGVTYSDMVDLSLNQTLMRSLNTSITALIPILSLLVVGSFILGATTLEEFGFALLVGLFSGAYSSIFIASPMLALLKEREPRYRDVRRRMEARVVAGSRLDTARADLVDEGEVEATDGEAVAAAPRPRGITPAPTGAIPPRPRKKTRKR